MVVFAARKGLDAAHVDRYLARISEVRGVPVAALAEYRKMMVGTIESQSAEQVDQWSARQVYLALGTFLTTAGHDGHRLVPDGGDR